jgi:N-acetylornithine carbamoyltransferase
MAHGLPASLRGRDFIQLSDLSREELDAVLTLAFEMKREQKVFRVDPKTVVMLFFNYSLRTRTSFEIGCRQIGLSPLAIDASTEGWDLEWREGAVMSGSAAEHVKDAARVLSRYADAIAVRSYPPMKNLAEDRADPLMSAFRKYATVPVINLESATAHPCQGLGDLMTLRELFPSGMKGKKVVLTWVPGPQPYTQSVANTFAYVAAMSGANVVLAHPEGFELAPEVMERAGAAAKSAGGKVNVVHDRDGALEGADVVYAKSWVSSKWYGDWPAEQKVRAGLANWTVSAESLEPTHRAKFMHPLPLRRNVVAEDAVVDGPDCVIYQQAENRLHVQKALMAGLMG